MSFSAIFVLRIIAIEPKTITHSVDLPTILRVDVGLVGLYILFMIYSLLIVMGGKGVEPLGLTRVISAPATLRVYPPFIPL